MQSSVAAAIAPSSFLLAAMYALLAVVHPLVIIGTAGVAMSILAAASCVLLIFCGIFWRRVRSDDKAHLVMGLMAIVVLINTTSQFIAVPIASNTSNYIMYILGVGVLVQSRYWVYPLLLAGLISWALIVYLIPINFLDNWGWFLLVGVMVSVVLHEQRIAATKEIATRELQQRSNALALNQLVRSEKLTVNDKQGMFEDIVRTGQAQFDGSRVSIWLVDLIHECLQEMANSDPYSELVEIKIHLIEDYYDALDRHRTIDAATVVGDSRFAGLEGYLTSHKILSKLDAAILVNGTVAGVVSIEERIPPSGKSKPREWTLDEKAFVASLADMATLALQAEERFLLERRSAEVERLGSLATFAGIVAHDFSKLLDEIKEQSEQLDLAISDPALKVKLQKILEAERKAKGMAEQMLSFSGQSNSIRQIYDLTQIVEDTVSEMNNRFDGEMRVTLKAPSVELPVEVDVAQLRQVINSLVANSRDSASTEAKILVGTVLKENIGKPDDTEVDAFSAPEYAWVEVNDNGKGLDEEALSKIFDPFFTSRPATSWLGLAAANGIVKAHGGRIQAASKFGVGSRFRVLLPLKNVGNQAQRIAESEEFEAIDDINGAGQSVARNIMLVDDDPMVSLVTRRFLEAEGYEITTFSGFNEAREYIDSNEMNFHCAIIDLSLGDGGGEFLVPLLRDKDASLPVVLMSGDLSAVSSSPASDIVYLQKPFEQPDLVAAVDTVTAQSAKTTG